MSSELYPPKLPETLIVDTKIMEYAVELAIQLGDEKAYKKPNKARQAGKEVADLLDSMAADKGLIGRLMRISGPSVRVPHLELDSRDGSVVLEPGLSSSYEELAPYEDVVGTFYGFDAIAKSQRPPTDEDDDTLEDSTYKPAIVVLVKTGAKVETPVATVTLSVYGDVTDTQVAFIEDEQTSENFQTNQNILERGQYATNDETKEISFFYRALEEPLSSDSYKDMISCIESLGNIKNDELNNTLIDHLVFLLKQKLTRESDNFVCLASFALTIKNLGLKNEQIVMNIPRQGDSVLEYVGTLQDILLMPKMDHVVEANGQHELIIHEERSLYFVYSRIGKPNSYIPAHDYDVI